MDVFVIPVGSDRYELYCEAPVEVPPVAAGSNGIIERIKFRFAVLAHEAEELRRSGASARAETRLGRLKQSFMAWFAERRAEHRLLSNLRHERAVVAFHPQDLTFEQTHTLIRRTLQREWERHRLWLVIDSVLLIASIPLTLLPGPNVAFYYFAYRVYSHWASIRGTLQGLREVVWTGQPCEPLTTLREAAALKGEARDRCVHAIAEQLRLQHLSTFFERVAIRSA